MGLNDEAEKLRQAEGWLRDCEVGSQHYKAAWEHVTWLLTYTKDPALREGAQKLADLVLGKDWAN